VGCFFDEQEKNRQKGMAKQTSGVSHYGLAIEQ
jgi:hypothetical protein